MKNIKLTLATTLSVMALAFTGNAFADGDRNHNSFERQVNKSKVQKVKHKKYAHNKTITKRVVVKNTPTRKVVVTKTSFRQPVANKHVKTKRFQHVKRFNKQYNRYQQRVRFDNRNKRYNQKRVSKQIAYSVRPGDTLIQISYKTGVSVQRLARLNRINNRNLNRLVVGQVLRLI